MTELREANFKTLPLLSAELLRCARNDDKARRNDIGTSSGFGSDVKDIRHNTLSLQVLSASNNMPKGNQHLVIARPQAVAVQALQGERATATLFQLACYRT